MDSEPPTDERTEAFLSLLGEHERKLGIYVTGLVACPQDAQDILQEGKIVMWRQFHKFELGTNFTAWSFSIARYCVMEHRRKLRRDGIESMYAIVFRRIDQLLKRIGDHRYREDDPIYGPQK